MKLKYALIISLMLITLTLSAVSASENMTDENILSNADIDELEVKDNDLNDSLSLNEGDEPISKGKTIITIQDEDDIKLENEYSDIVKIFTSKNSKGNVSVISGDKTLFDGDISKLYYDVDDKYYAVKLLNLTEKLNAGKLKITVKYDKYSKEGTLTLKNIDYSKCSPIIRIGKVVFSSSRYSFCQIDDDDYLNGTVYVYLDGKRVYTEKLGLLKDFQCYGVGSGIHHRVFSKKMSRGTHVIKVVYKKNGVSKPFIKKNTIYYTTPKHFKLSLKTIKVKKSAKKINLKATLKINGKRAKDVRLVFAFNKHYYVAKTNKNGVAKVTIKKNLFKSLKIGKKVNYSVERGNRIVKKTAVVGK